MKRILLTGLLMLAATGAYAYKILYAEQFYKLYHQHFYQAPDDTMENIFYLERALKADFCNPLYALAKINNKKEWEKYRYLFKMHVNLLMIKSYLTLGSKWDKRIAYFYNEPWKRQNLESLDTAEELYRLALYYWKEAQKWSKKAIRLPFHMEQIQNWHDENYRIAVGELDYADIIQEQLDRVAKVRKTFEAMDENTY